jgi:hypothetical protein
MVQTPSRQPVRWIAQRHSSDCATGTAHRSRIRPLDDHRGIVTRALGAPDAVACSSPGLPRSRDGLLACPISTLKFRSCRESLAPDDRICRDPLALPCVPTGAPTGRASPHGMCCKSAASRLGCGVGGRQGLRGCGFRVRSRRS